MKFFIIILFLAFLLGGFGFITAISVQEWDYDARGNRITNVANPIEEFDVVNLKTLQDSIKEVVYFADSYNLLYGTYISGSIEDTYNINVNKLEIREVTGSPGFNIEFNFTNISEFNRIKSHLRYYGTGATHVVDLELYDWEIEEWQSYTQFILSDQFQFIDIPIDTNVFISENNTVLLRFIHYPSGSTNHYLHIDYLALHKVGLGSTGFHSELLGLENDDHPQYFNEERGDERYAQLDVDNSYTGTQDFSDGWENGGVSIIGGDILAQTLYVYNITALEVNSLQVNGSIIPQLDNSFDIGSDTHRYRNLYLAGDIQADNLNIDKWDSAYSWGNHANAGYLTSLGSYTAGRVLFGNLEQDNALFWDNTNKRLGIGTTPMVEGLQIKRATSATQSHLRLTNDANINTDFLIYGSANTGTIFGVARANYSVLSTTGGPLLVGTNHNSNLYLGSNSLVRMTIKNDGNVGIGTASPATALDVAGTTQVGGSINTYALSAVSEQNNPWNPSDAGFNIGTLRIQNDYAGTKFTGIEFRNNNYGTNGWGYMGMATEGTTRASMVFAVRDASGNILEKMRIFRDGQIGIGVTNPATALHIKAGTSTLAPLRINAGTSTTTEVSGNIEYDGTKLYVTDSTPKRQELVQASYGHMYANGVSSDELPTANTAYKYDKLTAGESSDYITISSSRMTVNSGGAGKYFIALNGDATPDNAAFHEWLVYKNGALVTTIPRAFGYGASQVGGNAYSASTQGILDLAVNDYVEVYIKSTRTGDIALSARVSISMHRVGR